MFGDRVMTASPIPFSDLGEEDERAVEGVIMSSSYQDVPDMAPPSGSPPTLPPLALPVFRYGGEYDPDGEYVLEVEPSSPDKMEGVMLFPER